MERIVNTWDDIKDLYNVSGLDITLNAIIVCERAVSWTNTGTRPCTIKGPGGLRFPAESGPWENGLILNGSGFVVQGITVTECREAGIRVLADDVTIVGCTVKNCGVGIWLEGTRYLVQSNYVSDGVMTVNDTAWNNDFGAIGIKVKTGPGTIEQNVISNMLAPSYDYGKDGSGIEIYGDKHNVHDVTISDNLFYRVNTGLESGTHQQKNTVRNIVFKDNLLYYPMNDEWKNWQFYTLHLGGGSGSFGFPVDTDGYHFVNNTLYNLDTTNRFLNRAPEAHELEVAETTLKTGDKTLDDLLNLLPEEPTEEPVEEPEFVNIVARLWGFIPLVLSINKKDLIA